MHSLFYVLVVLAWGLMLDISNYTACVLCDPFEVISK